MFKWLTWQSNIQKRYVIFYAYRQKSSTSNYALRLFDANIFERESLATIFCINFDTRQHTNLPHTFRGLLFVSFSKLQPAPIHIGCSIFQQIHLGLDFIIWTVALLYGKSFNINKDINTAHTDTRLIATRPGLLVTQSQSTLRLAFAAQSTNMFR